MPSTFTHGEVDAVAALANLELTPDERELFARQLAEILAYADAVLRVDTTGVPPTATVVSGHADERADELRPCLDVDAALANAPDAARPPAGSFFRVPRVIG
jgi:aspartyl-tRNA(Asn)/glutamyl-tRNA(Gln) amidotransferase subunit C